jgi:hypothetical protein
MIEWEVALIGHLYYALECTAFVMRNILYLRLLAIAAATFAIAYFSAQSERLWVPIFWNAMYVAINSYQVYVLLSQRRPRQFTDPNEDFLYTNVFHALPPGTFQNLINAAQVITVQPEAILYRQNDHVEHIYIIAKGAAEIVYGGRSITTYPRGSFLGELSFTTGRTATATVKAKEEMTCYFWQHEAFREFLENNPYVENVLNDILGLNLINKLKSLQ